MSVRMGSCPHLVEHIKLLKLTRKIPANAHEHLDRKGHEKVHALLKDGNELKRSRRDDERTEKDLREDSIVTDQKQVRGKQTEYEREEKDDVH
jgi:hypothetical protein